VKCDTDEDFECEASNLIISSYNSVQEDSSKKKNTKRSRNNSLERVNSPQKKRKKSEEKIEVDSTQLKIDNFFSLSKQNTQAKIELTPKEQKNNFIEIFDDDAEEQSDVFFKKYFSKKQ